MFRKPGMFLLASFVAIFLTRYPALLIDRPIGLDESGLLAGVLTAQSRGFVPWKDFDVTTVGPATTFFLAAASSVVRRPLSYLDLHVIAALVWTLTSVGVVGISRITSGVKGAVLCFLILLGMSFMAWSSDYFHFTSELVPAMLLTSGAVLITLIIYGGFSGRAASLMGFVGGMLASLAVLAKLQALPIAAVLIASLALASSRNGWKQTAMTGVAAIAGGILPLLVLGVFLAREGQLAIAIQSYVAGNASYGASSSLDFEFFRDRMKTLAFGWWALQPFFLLIALTAGVLAVQGWRPWPLLEKRILAFFVLAGWFGAALVSVLVPDCRFEHHGIFLVAPSVSLLTFLLCQISPVPFGGPGPKGSLARATGRHTDLIVCGLLIVGLIWAFPRMQKSLRTWIVPQQIDFPGPALAEVCRLVDELSDPGQPIAVWGWAPEIFVMADRPNATRHVIGHFLIDENAARAMHRRTFMADLRESRPKVIVDAVAPDFFTWRWGSELAPFRADAFPELSAFLQQNYRVVERFSQEGAKDQVIVYASIAGN